jgi:hypothetical protein
LAWRWRARARAISFVALTALAVGCDDDDDAPPPAPRLVPLTAVEHLTRASMALRGTRPSLAELEAALADPRAIESIVDGYLGSAEFGATVRDIHADALFVRVDPIFAGFLPKPPIDDLSVGAINESITEAPLRLIEHVVMTDRPYTEIVTADYTVADRIVAAVWGLPYDAGRGGWQEAQWTDARAGAGILGDPWIFARHTSTFSNAHRGRANTISRALLCYDFVTREVVPDGSVNLADPDAVLAAVSKNPACASCHQVLDPLASFFEGWIPIYAIDEAIYPIQPHLTGLSALIGIPMRPPAYFGRTASTLAELGDLMVADPRFSACAVRRFYAHLHAIPLDEVPLAELAALQTAFIDEGFDAKILAKRIVLGASFATAYAEDAERALSLVGYKKARPEQLGRLFEDLTGFVWRARLDDEIVGDLELLGDGFIGYAVLGGGTDGKFVTQPARTATTTSQLVLGDLAARAAGYVVEADAVAAPADRRLLGTSPDDAGEAAVRAELARLHLRLFAETVAPESDEVNESWQLFADALALGGEPRRAWKVVLAAMLQDARIAYY